MTRLALLVIRLATPRREREWVVGDTVEELARLRNSTGERAARRWLQREMWRVVAQTPRHRLAVWRGSAGAADAAIWKTEPRSSGSVNPALREREINS